MTATATAHPFATQLAKLDKACEGVWKTILNTEFYRQLENGTLPIPVLRRYFLETFHYVRENAKNQAMVIKRLDDSQVEYTRYALKHALEESGHELMALNDLKSLGFTGDLTDYRPLPTTAAFIGYLYDLADRGNPVGRIGYSYFAEGAHTYLEKGIAEVKKHYGLRDDQLTFFVAHGMIDEHHFEDVQNGVGRFCRNEQDWADVEYVLNVTGKMTAVMLDEIMANPID